MTNTHANDAEKLTSLEEGYGRLEESTQSTTERLADMEQAAVAATEENRARFDSMDKTLAAILQNASKGKSIEPELVGETAAEHTAASRRDAGALHQQQMVDAGWDGAGSQRQAQWNFPVGLETGGGGWGSTGDRRQAGWSAQVGLAEGGLALTRDEEDGLGLDTAGNQSAVHRQPPWGPTMGWGGEGA